MWSEDYCWHYDYVRLAIDAGFSFEKLKYCNLDKSKISAVNIEEIVKQRDVGSVEKYIPIILQYVLDQDQAEVLDTNFVKIFRISQLSVEYLLFCKKYLDNTIILLKEKMSKIKEQNNELKTFATQLEHHIELLSKKLKEKDESIITFKCSHCTKVFSTEEYLNSHIKRRHIIIDDSSTTHTENNTDKLQSEIKQLKERLNNTEKLIQDHNTLIIQDSNLTEPSGGKNEEDKVTILQIQERFDKLREQVENELKILQMQKSFYEDKYEKWFDVMYQNSKQLEKCNGSQIDGSDDKLETFKQEIKRIETTTQTTKDQNLQVECVQNKNVFHFKESDDTVDEVKEMVPHIQEQIAKFEETIESKVTGSLQKIETQMQAFWQKLYELESNNHKKQETDLNVQQRNDKTVTNEITESCVTSVKPVIKPRSKFSKVNNIREENKENVEKYKKAIVDIESKAERKMPVFEPTVLISNPKLIESADVLYPNMSSSDSDSSRDSDNIQEEQKPNTKPSTSTLGQRSITSLRKAADSKEILEKLRNEVQNVLENRLQELGISPHWKGLPQKSYEKAVKIINHQATLTKKTFPEFSNIRESIEKSLENETAFTTRKGKNRKKRMSPSHRKVFSPKHNIIDINIRKKSNTNVEDLQHKTIVATKAEIKNRSIYETDTESEPVIAPSKFIKPADAGAQTRFAAVIEELKSLSPKPMDSEHSDIDVGKKENQTKGVLKNYPSVGSLSKKKVIFDIDSDSSKIDDKPIVQKVKDGGSTTSLGSSVLDDFMEEEKESMNEKKKKTENDIESLSDFDFSEM